MKFQLRIEEWLLEIDADQTKSFYNKGFEVCDCAYCANFAAAAGQMSLKLLSLLTAMGINPAMPAELSEFPSEQKGFHRYVGFYHFTGEVLAGELSTLSSWSESNTLKIDNFTIGFSTDLLFVPDGFPSPVLQLEFETDIPWVLDTPLEIVD